MSHRLLKAEGNLWAHSQILFAPSPVMDKLSAWCRGPGTSAVFGSMNWNLTSDILHDMWSWELRWLRRCFQLPRRPGEDHVGYLIRTAERIKWYFELSSHRPIHIRILTAYHNSAYEESSRNIDGNSCLLLESREVRSRILWESVKDMHGKRRKIEGFLQRSQGQKSYWEDPLVDFYGLDWRTKRLSMTWTEWRDHTDAFVRATCARWSLSLCKSSSKHDARDEQRASGNKDRLAFRGGLPEADEVLETVAGDIPWSSDQQSFAYVTDCLSLQGAVCGSTRVRAETHDVIVGRIVSRLVDHFCHQGSGMIL